MAGKRSPDGPADPAAGYEDQDLSTRIRHGVAVDRRANNVWSAILNQIMEMKETGALQICPPAARYNISRDRLWQTRRLANARLLDKTRIHGQIMMAWDACMLDILADRQPTVKDWSKVAGKDDRQTRRAREHAPNLVQNMDMMTYQVIRGPDGTTKIPSKTVRDAPLDERLQQITTSYSSPAMLVDSFDLKRFADYAYVVRQKRFWKDALKALSRWLGNGNAIRPDNEWIIRHMVNNDIAMHVIFDNISRELEARWFQRLGDQTQYEIAGRLKMEWETVPCTKEDLEACQNEARDRFVAATKLPAGTSYALQVGDEEVPLDFDTMRKEYEVTLQIISWMAEADGGLRHPIKRLEYARQTIAGEDVAKAVDEMAIFVDSFEESVPENLQRYMIKPDKMDQRVQDIILEAIAEMRMGDSTDEWLAVDAMTKRFTQRFGGLRRKPDSCFGIGVPAPMVCYTPTGMP